MHPERWEHGSDFHYLPDAGTAVHPWREAVLTGSGRDALRVLLAWGRAQRGWKRLWCPTFYCQDVVAAVLECGLEVLLYPDRPAIAPPYLDEARTSPGDVVLVLNHFGARSRPAAMARAGVEVIEDHTHDLLAPWAMESDAHYAVASLRKTLPVPDGGAIWSPRALPLPAEPALTPAHAQAAFDRLSGMLLKARYLAGEPIEKEAYRARAVAGEAQIGQGTPSAMAPVSRALLGTMPTAAWRAARAANYAAFRRSFGAIPAAELLPVAEGAVAYAVTLVFRDRALRDKCRTVLVAERVYPAVLWSLDAPAGPALPKDDVDFGGRVLSVHCDQRYTCADMERVAAIVRSSIEASA